MINSSPSKITSFLADHNWRDAQIEPLAGDASFRRYFRIIKDSQRAMLMDAPPPEEDVRPFLFIADWLHQHGFRAPQIYARDPQKGLILLEDFGDLRMKEAVEGDYADQQGAIYRSAIDTLIRLRDLPAAGRGAYDRSEYQREAALLTDWYCPAQKIEVDHDDYIASWDKVLDPLLAQHSANSVTVLRDYHAENIMLLANGEQGLIDFQDALDGDPAYDLVSLLQDARRDIPQKLETEMLQYYLENCAEDGADFAARYAILGAQRNAKIVGIFVRLWQRDGKPNYLKLIPRVWAYLERDLAHPALAPVARWFDQNIAPRLRAQFGGAFGRGEFERGQSQHGEFE